MSTARAAPEAGADADDPDLVAAESRSLISNSGVMVASRVVTAAIGWAGTVVIARTLSPDDWGRYSFIFGLLGVLALVTDLGVGRAVLARLTAADPEEAKEVAGSFILLRVVLGILGFVIAVLYAAATGLSPALVAVVAFAATGVVLATPAHALFVLYQARLRLAPVALWDAGAQLVQLGLILLVAHIHPSLAWFIVPAIAKEVVNLAARSFGVLRGAAGPVPDFSAGARYWGEMLREAIPISIGYALVMLLTRVDILILQLMDTYESVGRYAIGYKFSDLTVTVVTTLSLPLTTVLIKAWPDQGNVFRHRTRQAMVVAGGLGLLAAIGFWPTAGYFVGLLYGEDFVEAAGAARMLVVAGALSGITNIGIVALIAARKLTVFPWVAAGGVLLNLALNYVAIPRWSYHGAAAATLVTESVLLVACLVLVQRSIPMRGIVPWGPLARQVLLAVSVAAPATVLIGYSGWPWPPVVVAALVVFVAMAEFSGSTEDVTPAGWLAGVLGRRRREP